MGKVRPKRMRKKGIEVFPIDFYFFLARLIFIDDNSKSTIYVCVYTHTHRHITNTLLYSVSAVFMRTSVLGVFVVRLNLYFCDYEENVCR